MRTELLEEFCPWRVLCGDALGVIRRIPDNYLDAVVTDPPYCAGAVAEAKRTSAAGQGLRRDVISRFGWFVGDNMGTAGLAFLLRDLAFECRRVVRPTGSLLVFCDWRMLSALQPAIESAGLRYQNLIVWDKGAMGLGQGFRAQHELVMHFTFGAPKYHARDESNVIEEKRVHHTEREHQTQKPEELMRRLVRIVAPPGGIVFDPFMGSGSTGAACLREGLRFIGVDSDRNHVETATKRLGEIKPLTRSAAVYGNRFAIDFSDLDTGHYAALFAGE